MNHVSFRAAVNTGLEVGDWGQLEDWVADEPEFVFKNPYWITVKGEFSDEVYKQILALLSDANFLNSQGVSKVLQIIESDWGLLSRGQKEKLLPVLVLAYPKIADPFAWFLTSEILGGHFANAEALASLRQLVPLLTEDQRSLIPLAYEQLVQFGADETIRSLAFDELEGLKSDSYQRVRDEVEISLERLSSEQL